LVIHADRENRVCFMATPGDSPGQMARIEARAVHIATFDPPTILTLIAAARPAVVSDEVVEVTDRKSQWMLENSEGRWLHNAEDGTFTSDPNLGLKWPNRTAADAFRLSLRGPLWALKLTEHVWIEPDPYDWTDAEDDIADAISDSIDMDWSSRDGARAVVAYLKQIGAKLP
ncbi:MAG: hypothetical protein KAZ48_10715, partial [Candidatus Nanopelagicales bacterium]|nr:hypothetical protein [Candidatus Nanopelagicales bacterium]